jgi:hypothetical protein
MTNDAFLDVGVSNTFTYRVSDAATSVRVETVPLTGIGGTARSFGARLEPAFGSDVGVGTVDVDAA